RLLYSYLPFLCISICNLKLIWNLKQSTVKSTVSNHKRSIRVTSSVIIISVSFLVLVIPVAVLEQFEFYFSKFKYYESLLSISYLLMYFNHSISFFLFLLGTQFRQSVKKIIMTPSVGIVMVDTPYGSRKNINAIVAKFQS
ncbi:unnamed protein product, partial [Didymodactylos carnosus]